MLKASASWQEIKTLCEEALAFKTASACIPPSYVKEALAEFGKEIVICTVVGFPLGYSISDVKKYETEKALNDGASEIDMVINIGDLKNRHYERLLSEISVIKKICADKVLKVIAETCYLEKEEKIKLCKIVNEAGADFIKTSTGFGSAGASVDDILLFREHIAANVKIKAAGGIKTREDMTAMINAGADRIGSSLAVKILSSEQ